MISHFPKHTLFPCMGHFSWATRLSFPGSSSAAIRFGLFPFFSFFFGWLSPYYAKLLNCSPLLYFSTFHSRVVFLAVFFVFGLIRFAALGEALSCLAVKSNYLSVFSSLTRCCLSYNLLSSFDFHFFICASASLLSWPLSLLPLPKTLNTRALPHSALSFYQFEHPLLSKNFYCTQQIFDRPWCLPTSPRPSLKTSHFAFSFISKLYLTDCALAYRANAFRANYSNFLLDLLVSSSRRFPPPPFSSDAAGEGRTPIRSRCVLAPPSSSA